MTSRLGPNAQKRYFAAPSTTNPSRAPSQQNLLDKRGNTPQPAFVKPPVTVAAGTLGPFGPGAARQTTTVTKAPSLHSSVSEKYSLSPDPYAWGTDLSRPEDDDAFHNPEALRDRKLDSGGHLFTERGLVNVGCLLILGVGLIALFAGYPVITYVTRTPQLTNGGFNFGGLNASGVVPEMPYGRGLIDPDTPKEVYTKPAIRDGSELRLVFSDEFNVDGRSFYPGHDPYWEAVDLHYWVTENLEWYEPGQLTTKDGALEITLDRKNPADNHDLEFVSGMMTTWNKFCFTGGLIEAAVMLPGAHNVMGLWPAVWTMGNLGRAGHGATTDGMWPYSYDECDVGTLPNQTFNGLPIAATVNGDPYAEGVLSYLPGQRLSRCTCPGETHPGPVHSDGTYVGRSAPEIDVIEAIVNGDLIGEVSQSGQWAPFDESYEWKNDSTVVKIWDDSTTQINSYKGGRYQEAVSGLTRTNVQCYELSDDPCFSVYGFEYQPGFDGAYIAWVSDNKPVWMVEAAAVGKNERTEISARPVPQEPMYIILNLGMSRQFGIVDLDHLTFPTTMRVDYVRVYQSYGKEGPRISCDPPDFPTAAYIEQFLPAYTNPNFTTWVDDFKQQFPKNRLIDQC